MDNPISGVLVSGAGGLLVLSAALLHWYAMWIMVGAVVIASGLLWSAETVRSQLPTTASGDRSERRELPWWLE